MSNSKQPTIMESWGGATKRPMSEVRFPMTAANQKAGKGRGTKAKAPPKKGRGRGRGGKKPNFDAEPTIYLDDEDDICRQALGEVELAESNIGQAMANVNPTEKVAGFDETAGQIWIYPTNKPVRDYQFNIVKTALFHNTLVSLPTGLGKTFIAAVVMYNYNRWFPNHLVVFMAPTRPLVTQQLEACHKIAGIHPSKTVELTGMIAPKKREEYWKSKRVFFLTPQVMLSDLTRGTCNAEDVRCVVVDEAHKALGNHAYAQVIEKISTKNINFRVLALSATPGSDVPSVQQIFKNLHISRLELRGENSPDILPYTHRKDVEKVVVPMDGYLQSINDKLLDIFQSYTGKLMKQNVLFGKDGTSFSRFQLLRARDSFRQYPPNRIANFQKGYIELDFATCISLAHAVELLMIHGLRSMYLFLDGTLKNQKGNAATAAELRKNANVQELLEDVKTTLKISAENSTFDISSSSLFACFDDSRTSISDSQKCDYLLSHPKMKALRDIVMSHFKKYETSDQQTKVMIFSQYRDSVQEIGNLLSTLRPLVKPMVFFGQANTGTSGKGFKQKDQVQVVQKFREGGFNVLVATSVGEEGLDIGEVDLIICFDCSKSPTRLVQRMGRTGRGRTGRIIFLLSQGKEEKWYSSSLSSQSSINKNITDATKLKPYLFKASPRMVPNDLDPQCFKMNVLLSSEQSLNQESQSKQSKTKAGTSKSSSRDNNNDITGTEQRKKSKKEKEKLTNFFSPSESVEKPIEVINIDPEPLIAPLPNSDTTPTTPNAMNIRVEEKDGYVIQYDERDPLIDGPEILPLDDHHMDRSYSKRRDIDKWKAFFGYQDPSESVATPCIFLPTLKEVSWDPSYNKIPVEKVLIQGKELEDMISKFKSTFAHPYKDVCECGNVDNALFSSISDATDDGFSEPIVCPASSSNSNNFKKPVLPNVPGCSTITTNQNVNSASTSKEVNVPSCSFSADDDVLVEKGGFDPDLGFIFDDDASFLDDWSGETDESLRKDINMQESSSYLPVSTTTAHCKGEKRARSNSSSRSNSPEIFLRPRPPVATTKCSKEAPLSITGNMEPSTPGPSNSPSVKKKFVFKPKQISKKPVAEESQVMSKPSDQFFQQKSTKTTKYSFVSKPIEVIQVDSDSSSTEDEDASKEPNIFSKRMNLNESIVKPPETVKLSEPVMKDEPQSVKMSTQSQSANYIDRELFKDDVLLFDDDEDKEFEEFISNSEKLKATNSCAMAEEDELLSLEDITVAPAHIKKLKSHDDVVSNSSSSIMTVKPSEKVVETNVKEKQSVGCEKPVINVVNSAEIIGDFPSDDDDDEFPLSPDLSQCRMEYRLKKAYETNDMEVIKSYSHITDPENRSAELLNEYINELRRKNATQEGIKLQQSDTMVSLLNPKNQSEEQLEEPKSSAPTPSTNSGSGSIFSTPSILSNVNSPSTSKAMRLTDGNKPSNLDEKKPTGSTSESLYTDMMESSQLSQSILSDPIHPTYGRVTAVKNPKPSKESVPDAKSTPPIRPTSTSVDKKRFKFKKRKLSSSNDSDDFQQPAKMIDLSHSPLKHKRFNEEIPKKSNLKKTMSPDVSKLDEVQLGQKDSPRTAARKRVSFALGSQDKTTKSERSDSSPYFPQDDSVPSASNQETEDEILIEKIVERKSCVSEGKITTTTTTTTFLDPASPVSSRSGYYNNRRSPVANNKTESTTAGSNTKTDTIASPDTSTSTTSTITPISSPIISKDARFGTPATSTLFPALNASFKSPLSSNPSALNTTTPQRRRGKKGPVKAVPAADGWITPVEFNPQEYLERKKGLSRTKTKPAKKTNTTSTIAASAKSSVQSSKKEKPAAKSVENFWGQDDDDDDIWSFSPDFDDFVKPKAPVATKSSACTSTVLGSSISTKTDLPNNKSTTEDEGSSFSFKMPSLPNTCGASSGKSSLSVSSSKSSRGWNPTASEVDSGESNVFQFRWDKGLKKPEVLESSKSKAKSKTRNPVNCSPDIADLTDNPRRRRRRRLENNPYIEAEADVDEPDNSSDECYDSDELEAMDANDSFVVAGDDEDDEITDSQQVRYIESVKDVIPARSGKVDRPLPPVVIGDETQAELGDYEDDSFCVMSDDEDGVEFSDIGVFTQAMIEAKEEIDKESPSGKKKYGTRRAKKIAAATANTGKKRRQRIIVCDSSSSDEEI